VFKIRRTGLLPGTGFRVVPSTRSFSNREGSEESMKLSVSLEGSVEYLMIYLVTGLSLDSSSPGEVKVIVALSQLNKT